MPKRSENGFPQQHTVRVRYAGAITEIIGADGRAITRAVYNASGAVMADESSDKLTLEQGGFIKRYVHRGGIELLRDEHGTRERFFLFFDGPLDQHRSYRCW